ncbi:hypothetical protein M2169_001967 [Streptomyces sp. MJP52]|nr:hypothetical protein [Streptomyces sp. MJP52]
MDAVPTGTGVLTAGCPPAAPPPVPVSSKPFRRGERGGTPVAPNRRSRSGARTAA